MGKKGGRWDQLQKLTVCGSGGTRVSSLTLRCMGGVFLATSAAEGGW